MQAAYFPFTSIDEGLSQLLPACFETIDLYLPSATEATNKGGGDSLILRFPEDDMDRQVGTIYQACLQWREATRGATPAFFKTGRAPFFDETSISFMRRELTDSRLIDADGKPDPLLHARIFLRLAADHDKQQTEVERSLELLNHKEKALFASLREGEETGPTAEPLTAAIASKRIDRGDLMTSDRLTAWATLALATGVGADMLITDSRAVVDYLHIVVPGGSMPVDRMTVSLSNPECHPEAADCRRPAWNRFWDNCLRSSDSQALTGPEFASLLSDPDNTPDKAPGKIIDADLTILLYPDTGLVDFLAALTGRGNIRSSGNQPSTPTGTLIACIRPF